MASNTLLKGGLWIGGGVVVSRLFSLISQIILGWYLTAADYGAYAAVAGITLIFASLRNGGVISYFISNNVLGSDMEEELLGYSTLVNVVLTFTLFVICTALFYKDATAIVISGVFVVSILTSLPSLIYRAKLSTELAYKKLAVIDSLTALLRSVSAITLAVAGFGALSLCIPFIIIALLEYILARYYLRFESVMFRKTHNVRLLWKHEDLKWLLLSAVLMGLLLNVDYFMLSFGLSKEELGYYFFAFQLTTAISSVFIVAIQNVVLPYFTKLTNDNPGSLNKVFITNLNVLNLLGFLIFILALLNVKWLIHLIWSGKWDSIVYIVQLGLIVLCFKLQSPYFLSLLEANNKWRVKFFLFGGDAFFLVIAATLAALSGNLEQAVWYIFTQRAISALVINFIIAYVSRVQLLEVFKAQLIPITLSCLSYSVVYMFALGKFNNDVVDGLICSVIFFTTYLVFGYFLTKILAGQRKAIYD